MSDLVVIETDVGVDFAVIGGESGPRGFKGDKGDKGDQGDKGDKGDTGDAGTVGDELAAEITRAENAEAAISTSLGNEVTRAEAAEAAVASALTSLIATLGSAATHPASDFDAAGAAAAAQAASQPLDSDLTAIAALTTTTFGRALLALVDAAAGRTAFDVYSTAQVDAAIASGGGTFQPLDSDLTAIAALTTTTFGRALLALADAAAGRTALGLGTASTHPSTDFDAAGAAAAAQAASQPLDSDLTAIAALSTTTFGRALLALADAAAGRTALGLGTSSTHPSTDFDTAGAAAAAQAASQPLDSDLTAIAALTTTTFGRALLALADAAAGRTALGLGTASTHPSTDFDTAGAAAAAQAASQPLDADLTSIAALTTTSFGRGFLALADAAAARAYIGAAATGATAVPFVVAASDASAAQKAAADVVSAGGGSADDTAIAALIAVAGTRPMRAYGTFAPSSAHSISGIDDVDLGGAFTIRTPDSTYPTPAFLITGSRTLLTTTWTDTSVAQGINVLNFSGTAPALVNGDRVAFTTDQGWGSRPGENFASEWLEVESVGSSSVVFKTPFRHTYTPSAASAIKVYKYNLIKRCKVDGVRVVGVGGTGNALTTSSNRERMFVVAYADRPIITNSYAEGPYAREGIATYECLDPTGLDIELKDVNDLAGSSGTYEAYGLRAMGCEGGLFDRIVGQGCRHIVDVNGGQSAYGLTAGTFRPLSHGFEIGTVKATKTWAAAVSDHPGAVGTFFRDITANGCSGAVIARGKNPKFGKVRMYGGHHLNGPYGSSQGNDHCITIGEQQRDSGGSDDNTTRDGWCGTDIEVLDVEHDMTGNAGTLGSTSHTVHAVHPLVRARIDFGAGVCKPTGNGLNAVGMYNDDIDVVGTVDLTAAFIADGQAVVLSPAATSPTVSTGQYNTDIRIDITAINPRNIPVVVAGSADTAARSDRIDVQLKVEGLGSGLTSAGPAIKWDQNPNGTNGFFGAIRARDLELTDFAFTTALDQSTATITTFGLYGFSRFSDGAFGKMWNRNQNAAPLQPFLAALSLVNSSPLPIFVDGDSKEEGTGVTSVYDVWIRRFKDIVCGATGQDPGSTGYIPACYTLSGPAWQTSLVGGDTVTSNGAGGTCQLTGNGPGKRAVLYPAGTTKQRTWTNVLVDRLAVLYTKSSSHGAIEVRINNVLVATIDTWQAGAGPTAAMWDSVTDGGITITPGLHNVKLTSVNTGTVSTFAVEVAGIFPYWANHDSGIQIWDGSHATFPSQSLSTIELAFITLINPKLFLHAKGVNDSAFTIVPSTTAANFVANVGRVNTAVSTDPAHAFINWWGNAGSQTPAQWAPYHDAIRNAATGIAALVDLGDALGFPNTTASGISDGVAHPDANGAEIAAQLVADALFVPPMSRNRTGSTVKLPAGGTFEINEVGGFPVAGVKNGTDQVGRAYLTALGGVGWGNGTGVGDAQALYQSDGSVGISAPWQAPVRRPTPVAKTANWTWALTEANKDILANPSGDIAGTVPPHSTAAWVASDTLRVINTSTHTITVTAGAGVTINVPGTLNLALTQQGDVMELEYVGSDVWQVLYSTDLLTFAVQQAALYQKIIEVTAVKTSAYTASVGPPGDMVMCDPSSGAFTITLPNAPSNRTVIAAKIVTQSSTNAVTIVTHSDAGAAGGATGTDVFDKTSGATSKTLLLLGETIYLQYRSNITAWVVVYHAAPVSSLDLRYAAIGIHILASVTTATVIQLAACTYANGTAGVGATLTANSNAAIGALNGYTPVLGDRVLVAAQASTFQNGIYTLTQVGDGSHPWIFTRATDFDEAAEMIPGVRVMATKGTDVGQEWWTSTTVTTVGTDAVTWARSNVSNAGGSYTVKNGANTAFALTSGFGITSMAMADGTGGASDVALTRGGAHALTVDATAGVTFNGPIIGGLAGFGIFGDGSDGAITFDGTTTVLGLAPSSSVYTLTRDIFLSSGSITGSTTIKCAGFKIFCSGTFTIGASALVTANGNAGAAGAAGGITVGGTTGSGAAGGAGGVGGVGTAPGAVTNAIGSAGGAGGNSTGGGTGGGVAASATSNAAANGTPRNLMQAMTLTALGGSLRWIGGNGGTGGTSTASSTGGGGGSGGGIAALYCYKLVNNGAIRALGGAGGNGTLGAGTGAGGGAGGGGGAIVLVVGPNSTTGTLTVTGGAGGTLAGTGATGAAGSTGSTYVLNL